MLTQKINALSACKKLLDIHKKDPKAPRMGMLDLAILLTINDMGEASKGGLKDALIPESSSKSSLDRPVSRLMEYGLIDKIQNRSAKTRSGEARAYYKITDLGIDALKGGSK